jgi:hypothetical protein
MTSGDASAVNLSIFLERLCGSFVEFGDHELVVFDQNDLAGQEVPRPKRLYRESTTMASDFFFSMNFLEMNPLLFDRRFVNRNDVSME